MPNEVHPHPEGDRPIIGALRHYFLPPSETFIYNSLRALDRYSPQVFAISKRSEEKFPLADVTALRSLPLGKLEALLYRVTSYSPRFFHWCRSIAVLHAHMGYTGVHGLMAARRHGIPLVTSFYGNDVAILGSKQRMTAPYWHYWALAKVLFKRGDRFLALSEDMKQLLIKRGCPEEKIRIVPLGIDLKRFDEHAPERSHGSRVKVLMVGREVEKKGFDDGLRACALAANRGVDLQVEVLGTGGPNKAALQALAQELGLPVLWSDPRASVPAAMAKADILLVPSRTALNGDREGTPTVIAEASAARLPIVASNHAGIPEQIEQGKTGLLREERNVLGFAADLSKLAASPKMRESFGLAGRAKAEKEYSLDVHREKLQSVYDEILGQPL